MHAGRLCTTRPNATTPPVRIDPPQPAHGMPAYHFGIRVALREEDADDEATGVASSSADGASAPAGGAALPAGSKGE